MNKQVCVMKRESTFYKLQKARQELKKLKEDLAKTSMKEVEERQAADQLVDEAHEKLKVAIGEGDMMKVRVAEGMLEGASVLHSWAKELQEKRELLQKKVDKRISYLLELLFKNHKKR